MFRKYEIFSLETRGTLCYAYMLFLFLMFSHIWFTNYGGFNNIDYQWGLLFNNAHNCIYTCILLFFVNTWSFKVWMPYLNAEVFLHCTFVHFAWTVSKCLLLLTLYIVIREMYEIKMKLFRILNCFLLYSLYHIVVFIK